MGQRPSTSDLLRTLNSLVASEHAYVSTPCLKGADEFYNASVDDLEALAELASQVGVKEIDPHTIKFTVLESGVYKLNLIWPWVTHNRLFWLNERDGCTEDRCDRWTDLRSSVLEQGIRSRQFQHLNNGQQTDFLERCPVL